MGPIHVGALPDSTANVCCGSAVSYLKYCWNVRVMLEGDDHRRSRAMRWGVSRLCRIETCRTAVGAMVILEGDDRVDVWPRPGVSKDEHPM